jgi:prepilin-type N-terminal cleavage/methylation domain-containing protein
MLGDDALSEIQGFTLVEIIVGVLIAGILAAIVVFSVATVTQRHPDPACTKEVNQVDDAITQYRVLKGANPKSLDVLVKEKLLTAKPSPTSPSGAAGFVYHAGTATYDGTCPLR